MLHRSLSSLLENEGVGDIGLSFTHTVPTREEGREEGRVVSQDVPLCRGGSTKEVSDENKQEYVALLLQARFKLYQPAARSFRAGLLDVLHHRLGRLILKIYTAVEFATLIGGVSDLPPSDWRAHTVVASSTFRPSTSSSFLPSVQGFQTPQGQKNLGWFWRVVDRLSREERALLLKFATGLSRLPFGGFEALRPAFTLQPLEYRVNMPLPMAATCFHTLKLPLYPSEAELERNVLLALRFGSEGFAFC